MVSNTMAKDTMVRYIMVRYTMVKHSKEKDTLVNDAMVNDTEKLALNFRRRVELSFTNACHFVTEYLIGTCLSRELF